MRKKGSDPIVLDLGNTFFKSVMPDSQKEAWTAFSDLIAKAHGKMKMDAITLGPKDFAMGTQLLQKVLKEQDVTVLAGNILDAATQKPLFKDYTIIQRDGYKIGLFGVVSREWKVYGKEIPKDGVEVEDPVEYARRIFPKVQAESQIVVALSTLNTSEAEAMAKALPDLKFIIRSNINGYGESKNHKIGTATGLAVPTRGKSLGLFTLTIRNKSLDFFDRSDRTDIERRIDGYDKHIKNMMKRNEVDSVEKLKKALEEKEQQVLLKRLERYETKIAEYQAQLKTLKTDQSFFELDRVTLDDKITDDLKVKAMVDEVIKKWGDPSRLKQGPGADKILKKGLMPNLPTKPKTKNK